MDALSIIKVFVLCSLLILVSVLIAVLAFVWTLPNIPKIDVQQDICMQSVEGGILCERTTEILDRNLQSMLQNVFLQTRAKEKLEVEEYFQKHQIALAQIYNANLLDMKPSAKLTGSTDEQPEGTDNMTTVLSWNSGRRIRHTTGFQRYGVTYKHGRLIVPVSGTYFIYSFMSMYETCDPQSGEPNIRDINMPLIHGMYKYNVLGNKETELVCNTQAHKTSQNKYFNYYDSYISTLVDLDAGDEISVKVSNISALRYPDENYFGLNLI